MKPKIWVVMYSPKTEKGSKIRKLSLKEQTENLENKIEFSYKYLKNSRGFDPTKEIVIFSAPEWYFRPPFDSESYYSIYDMEATFKRLQKFCNNKKFKSLLIIPGSFYYNMPGEVWNLVYNCTAAISSEEIISVIHKKMEDDIESDKKSIETWGMYDGLTQEEIRNNDKDGYEVMKSQAKMNYPIYNRSIIKKFQLDDDGRHSGLFQYKGLSFGIEICRDHSIKRLKSEAEERVDVQILISANVQPIFETCITKIGGCFLFNDGVGPKNSVYLCQSIKNDKAKLALITGDKKNAQKKYVMPKENGTPKILTGDEYQREYDNAVVVYDLSIEIDDSEEETWLTFSNFTKVFNYHNP